MAPFLTDDLLLEILSRGDAKSVCRFKCASTRLLALIDHPENRERLPCPMDGLVYTSTSTTTRNDNRLAHQFLDVWGSNRHPPSFAFLPKDVQLLDGCNGLLLLCCCRRHFPAARGYDSRYIVCNPATQQWATLPTRLQPGEVGTMRLGFDGAVSPHFHVFAILLDHRQRYITGVDVYSSETNRWVHKDSGSSCQPMWLSSHRASVFRSGYLHFCTISSDWACRVAAVNTEGVTWTSFERPKDKYDGFIQLSRGRLHYALFAKDKHEGDADVRLEIYVMDDYDNKEWTLKHSAKVADIFQGIHVVDTIRSFRLVAIHPDCSNLIFFMVGRHVSLACYNINCRRAKLITHLGSVGLPYVPYVPMYSELESLHM